MGVSPRRLSGWEPREFAVYEFNADGVRVGETRVREPEFTAHDVRLMVAHLRREADIGPHGQPLSEATSADANPSTHGGHRYEANTAPRIDWAAKALAGAQETYYKANPNAPRDGHLWYVRKVDAPDVE